MMLRESSGRLPNVVSFTFFTLLASLLFANTSGALPIDIAVNGSFEADDIPTNSIGGLLDPVTGWDSVPLLFDGEPAAVWPAGGADGPQYADCGNIPSSTCTQSLTVAAGFDLVEITWSANEGDSVGATPYSVEIRNVLDSVLASGTYTASHNNLVWTDDDLDLTSSSLGAGDYKLVIYGTDGVSGRDVLIDNVKIFVEVVPEPGTAIMLGLGLAGMTACRRNRVPIS